MIGLYDISDVSKHCRLLKLLSCLSYDMLKPSLAENILQVRNRFERDLVVSIILTFKQQFLKGEYF